MDLTFTAYITVGKEDYDYIKKNVNVSHDLTKEDLAEFVKEQGCNSIKDYFMTYIDEGTIEEDNAYYKEFIEPYTENDCDLLESEITIRCEDGKALKKFLVNKYQNKFNDKLLEALNDFSLYVDLD